MDSRHLCYYALFEFRRGTRLGLPEQCRLATSSTLPEISMKPGSSRRSRYEFQFNTVLSSCWVDELVINTTASPIKNAVSKTFLVKNWAQNAKYWPVTVVVLYCRVTAELTADVSTATYISRVPNDDDDAPILAPPPGVPLMYEHNDLVHSW